MKAGRIVLALAAVSTMVCTAAGGADPVKLQIDVDVYDSMARIRPYFGAEWIEQFFQNCRKHGVARVFWRCNAQIANFPSKTNYRLSEIGIIKSAADERRFDGAFAAKVGVGPQKPGAIGGIVQRIDNSKTREFMFRGMVGSDALPSGAFLAAIDAASGKVLARSEESRSYGLRRLELRFKASASFEVGVFSAGSEDTHVFVADTLSLRALDDPGAELLANANMEEVDHIMEPVAWRQRNARFVTLNGDVTSIPEDERRKRFPNIGGFEMRDGRNGDSAVRILRYEEDGDSLALAAKAAKRNGIELYAWLDPLDDGKRCLPPTKSESTRFMEEHPECRCTDAEGRARWGLLCFACPEVRAYKTEMVREVLGYDGIAGVALKTHYQHNMLWGLRSRVHHEFLYHPAITERYHARWGRPVNGKYSKFRLRKLQGEAVMEWLRELHPVVAAAGKKLCMFQAPVPFVEGMRTGGWYLPPERIAAERLCDEMLIEPRWEDGDNMAHFDGEDGVAIKRLIRTCRAAGVSVGFDLYYTAIMRKFRETRGSELYRQLVGLAKEDVDYIGIYQENHFRGLMKHVERAAKDIAGLPEGARAKGYADLEKGRHFVNAITPDACSEISISDGVGGTSPADELVVEGTVGDPAFAGYPSVPSTNSHLIVSFSRPLALSEIRLYTGHPRWKSISAAEDFKVTGLSGGEWVDLASVTDANTLKGGDQSAPNVCVFPKRTFDAIRVDFTRGCKNANGIVLRGIHGRCVD